MKFNELKSGDVIFIDSNIFIYHFTGISDNCSELLKQCEFGYIQGVVLVTTILEIQHRLMIIEAKKKRLITSGDVIKKLKAKPDIVKKLSDYNLQSNKIPSMGIKVYPLTLELIESAYKIRGKYGLLTNDSIMINFMLTK